MKPRSWLLHREGDGTGAGHRAGCGRYGDRISPGSGSGISLAAPAAPPASRYKRRKSNQKQRRAKPVWPFTAPRGCTEENQACKDDKAGSGAYPPLPLLEIKRGCGGSGCGDSQHCTPAGYAGDDDRAC